MAVVQIQMRQSRPAKGCALFNLGFRPFFLGAGIFAIVSIVWWMLIYSAHSVVKIQSINSTRRTAGANLSQPRGARTALVSALPAPATVRSI